MDFKGIVWAGDIYEKFEGMCLEVEEVIYEDTIKYVEKQVHKVGASVKTFYAEVMQDLLPSSRAAPLKVVAAADSPREPYAHDINKKPKPTISDNHGELDNKQAGVEHICDLTAEDSTLSVRRVLVGNSQSEERSEKSKRGRAVSSLPGDRSGLLVCDIRSNSSVASEDLNVTTSSEFFARHDPGEAVANNELISDASADSCNSDQILSAESLKQERNDSECACPAPDKELSAESRRQNNDATECNSSYHGLPPARIDKFKKDGSLSQMKSNIIDTYEVESAGEEAIASYEDNFDIEVIEAESILKPVEKSSFEESCILVEGDELDCASQWSKRHKSYKKKIFDVLSSKLRSSRRRDLCISDHEDLSDKKDYDAAAGAMSPARAMMDCDKRGLHLPAHSSCDFGWELL